MKAPSLNTHAGLFPVLTIIFLVGCGPAAMHPPLALLRTPPLAQTNHRHKLGSLSQPHIQNLKSVALKNGNTPGTGPWKVSPWAAPLLDPMVPVVA